MTYNIDEKRRSFTWPNQDDQMNITEPWQRQTLIFEHDHIETNKL